MWRIQYRDYARNKETLRTIRTLKICQCDEIGQVTPQCEYVQKDSIYAFFPKGVTAKVITTIRAPYADFVYCSNSQRAITLSLSLYRQGMPRKQEPRFISLETAKVIRRAVTPLNRTIFQLEKILPHQRGIRPFTPYLQAGLVTPSLSQLIKTLRNA